MQPNAPAVKEKIPPPPTEKPPVHPTAPPERKRTPVTNRAGELLEWYEYDDYGVPTIYAPGGAVRGASAIDNQFLYTGQRWFADLGLYYYRNRWYDPDLGRFLSRDPLGIWGDPMNLGNGTAYVGLNPWTFVDPLGLEGICRYIFDSE